MKKRLLYIEVFACCLIALFHLPMSFAATINPCFEREYRGVDINILDINGRMFYQHPNCETMDSDGDGIPDIYDECPSTFPVRIGVVDYTSLQGAYDTAVEGDTIKAQFVSFNEDVNVNRSVSITMDGGYDCLYTANTGMTTIEGNMTVSSGTVIIGYFIIDNTGVSPLMPPSGGGGMVEVPIHVSPTYATSTPAYIGN